MQELSTTPNLNTTRDDVFNAIEQQDAASLKTIIDDLHPGELADLLESMPPKERSFLWEHIPSELDADILAEVQDEVRTTLIRDMNHAELISAAAAMEVDDLAEVIEDLPQEMRTAVEDSLSDSIREKLETNLSFEEDTAGRLMSTDVVTIRPDVKLETVIRYLRWRGALPEHTNGFFIVDREGQYLGMLPIEALGPAGQSRINIRLGGLGRCAAIRLKFRREFDRRMTNDLFPAASPDLAYPVVAV